jgi:hypothetical protein
MSGETFPDFNKPTDTRPDKGLNGEEILEVQGAIDPGTRTPLLRSKEPDMKGQYQYYYLSDEKLYKSFKSKESGDTPQSLKDLNVEAESAYLDPMRPKK